MSAPIVMLIDGLIEAVRDETRALEWEDVPSARERVEGKVGTARAALLAAITKEDVMSDTKFKVGDVVRLKSGSPAMTVSEVKGLPENSVFTTMWCGERAEFVGVEIPMNALEFYEGKGEKPAA